MKRQTSPLQAMRTQALQLPETEEGIACAGTSLEKRTIKVGKKAFVFIGAQDVMLKLDQSLPEATRLAATNPGSVKAGAGGWVTVKFADRQPVSDDQLSQWLEESYRLFAPKQAGAKSPSKTTAATRPVKKAAGKKSTKVAKPKRKS